MRLVQVGPLFAKVDDEDWERLTNYGRWAPLRVSGKIYAKHDWKAHGIRGTYTMHRFIFNIHTTPGNCAPVDHIDHDGLNNQKYNLRITTKSINGINRKGLQTNNVSGINGVYWSIQKDKWHAEIKRNGRKTHVGFFDSLEEATTARQEKVKLYD